MPKIDTKIIISAVDKFSSVFNKMESNLTHVGNKIEHLASNSRKIALGYAAVAGGIGFLGKKMLDAAGGAEQTMIALETMLGSTQNAKKFYADLVNFAKKTPFEMKGLEDSSKKLLAFGFSQEDVLPNLKALGDIASGVGTEKLPNLILAFGQVKAATKLTGMELRQFTEAGVPLLDELAKQSGKSAAEIQDMVRKGAIGFPDVEKALKSLTGEGGRFNNLMDKQSKSLNGMISNLKDSWDIFLRGEGKTLIDWAKKFVIIAQDIVQNVLPKWIEKIKKMNEFFSQHKEILIIVAGAIMGPLYTALKLAIIGFAELAISMLPFIIGGAIVGGIIAGIVWIVRNWDMLSAKASEIFNGIKTKVLNSVSELKSNFIAGWEAISAFFGGIWQGMKDIVSFYISFIVGLVIFTFDKMGIDIVAVFTIIKDFFTTFFTEASQMFSDWGIIIKETWVSIWTPIHDFFTNIWGKIKTGVSFGLDWISKKFTTMTAPISAAWGSMWNAIGNAIKVAWEGIKNTIKGGINWMIDKINYFIKKANEIASKGAGALGISIPLISEIPKLAKGGIVTSPTIAQIGEAGPEAIIPLKNGAGGFGTTINITVNGDISGEELIDKVRQGIMNNMGINTRLTAGT